MDEFQSEDLFEEVDKNDSTEEYSPVQEEDRSTDRYFEDDKSQEKKEEKEKEEDKEDLFDESEEEDSEEDTSGLIEDYNDPVIDFLSNKGIIDISEDDTYQSLSGDDREAYIENKIEEAIQNRMSKSLQELPPVVRQLNEFALAGGNVEEFLSQIAYQNSVGIHEGMDINDPNNQEYIVRTTLQNNNYPPEYIESQIEFLKNSNSLGVHANTYFNQYIEYNRQLQEKMVQEQRQQAYEARNRIIEQRKALDNYLQTVDSVRDIPLSYRDKVELGRYITDQAYTLEDGSYISALQKDLYYDLLQNSEASLQLALLLKNRNADGTFNFDFMKKKAKTEVSKQIKQSLQRETRNVPTSSPKDSTVSYRKKSLADYF